MSFCQVKMKILEKYGTTLIFGCAAAKAYYYDRGCFFYITRILPRWDQNSGLLKKKIEIFFHIRSVILFHRNFTATVPKFRTYRSVFLFHQNFTATVPKFRTFQFYIQEVLLFSPEFYRDRTKIQDMQECVSFSPEFYRNRTKIQDFSISHTGGVSFFTRILPRPYQNSGLFNFTYRSVLLFHQNFTAIDQNSGLRSFK